MTNLIHIDHDDIRDILDTIVYPSDRSRPTPPRIYRAFLRNQVECFSLAWERNDEGEGEVCLYDKTFSFPLTEANLLHVFRVQQRLARRHGEWRKRGRS